MERSSSALAQSIGQTLAAAPELLAALRVLVGLAEFGDADDSPLWHSDLDAARAIIKRCEL